ncbi:hypothetical protein KC340_g8947 [Hortaea werneckii]|nr:hypothetical protein KC342_g9247 [Hortaea werneckii]KAI7095165.1 hypothetical protein KC339_g11185 [Hortaea werneckii]KAI7229261.1 hypothetical protein KC365_g8110 [Hortaea werneckii]KAI7315581.1 hypothetical protein KC340_g8947 [Hortaea werneckii]KAI7381013.1 hypothetical protein KC328_g12477 [Hortaea werneckii]
MAIHPNVPGMTVSIKVAGQDLPEHDDEDAQNVSPEVVRKYIEAISGAQFRMSVQFSPEEFQYANQTVVVSAYCDGQSTSKRDFKPKYTASNIPRFFGNWFATGKDGRVTERDLIFSDLTIHDGQVDKDLLGKLHDLGTITIKWYRATLKLRESYTANPGSEKGPRVGGQLPEKNLKGQSVTHHTTYGAERVVGRSRNRARSRYPARSEYRVDKVGEPFVVFKFKYRSRGALQSLGLLPRSPSPIPLEDRSIDDLSLQEARELLRRQQGRLASNEATVKHEAIKREIKRERNEDGDDDDGNGGVEIVDRPEKACRLNANGAGTDVIDLCSDD